MRQPITIRQAKQSDAPVLAALFITVWIDTYSSEGIEPAHAHYVLTEYNAESLSALIVSKAVYVAEIKGIVIGVAVLDETSGEIETLYVLPRFKRMGAGRLLVEALIKRSNTKLFLTCWDANDVALSFYRKLGFVESGEAFFDLDGKKIRNVKLTN